MYNANDYVLIKDEQLPFGYWIVYKLTRGIELIDDMDLAQKIVNSLLQQNVRVYENTDEFDKDYPPLTPEERKKMAQEFFTRSKKTDK